MGIIAMIACHTVWPLQGMTGLTDCLPYCAAAGPTNNGGGKPALGPGRFVTGRPPLHICWQWLCWLATGRAASRAATLKVVGMVRAMQYCQSGLLPQIVRQGDAARCAFSQAYRLPFLCQPTRSPATGTQAYAGCLTTVGACMEAALHDPTAASPCASHSPATKAWPALLPAEVGWRAQAARQLQHCN